MSSEQKKTTAIGPNPTNGGKETIDLTRPYRARVTIRGDADIIFHGWNCEAVEAKSKASKGSKAKKSDDLQSYVYRDDDGYLCIPGTNLLRSIIDAAKYKQDPRSPRKSAQDLTKAAIVTLTPMASLGVKEWGYEHKCRVQVNRNGITRVRPALKAGWTAQFVFMVLLPEYVPPEMLHGLLTDAGRLIGVCDFRPTYGRFQVTEFSVIE